MSGLTPRTVTIGLGLLLPAAFFASCSASSNGGGGDNTSFDSGGGDATFSSDSGGDGSAASLATCLEGIAAGAAAPTAACSQLVTCLTGSCSSQLTSCFGPDYEAGTIAGDCQQSFVTCATQSNCTPAAGASCAAMAPPLCQCCLQGLVQCAEMNCASGTSACASSLLSNLVDAGLSSACTDSGSSSGADSGSSSGTDSGSSSGTDSGTSTDSGADSGTIADSGSDAASCAPPTGLPVPTPNGAASCVDGGTSVVGGPLNEYLPGEMFTCVDSSGCGCPLVCVSDTIVGSLGIDGNRCERPCQSNADCPRIDTVCATPPDGGTGYCTVNSCKTHPAGSACNSRGCGDGDCTYYSNVDGYPVWLCQTASTTPNTTCNPLQITAAPASGLCPIGDQCYQGDAGASSGVCAP